MRLRYLVVVLVLAVAALGALWIIPADDFIFTPDRAKPLEDKVRVEGAHPVGSGSVNYVDVFVRRATLLEQLVPFTQPEGAELVPEQALLPPGTSEAERDRQNALDMQQSEVIASAVALRALGYDVKVKPKGVSVVAVSPDVPAAGKLEENDLIVAVDGQPIKTTEKLRTAIGRRKPGEDVRLTVLREGERLELTVATIASPEDASRPIVGFQPQQEVDIDLPIDVDIDLGRVGGPSAGLPFALEIVRMLGRDVTHGCDIAATGELAVDGSVLPVGGLEQKTIGARRTGVDVFLVPAGSNAAEAREHAGDLPVIPVKSFQQALQKLATADLNC